MEAKAVEINSLHSRNPFSVRITHVKGVGPMVCEKSPFHSSSERADPNLIEKNSEYECYGLGNRSYLCVNIDRSG